ncbi:efflux RND transporter periplasmic adaptor subunit [Undibacterium luofuense]|uniref:Efflux RND transporter periplasmic adaptor subunit n=1 Tax=Undibacterium luofuense TaxID=2828733 RepID=A0A941DL35_9BURK|nr:efflux RND transporter periplasmic adaptor subunit [Undibacterium luofuense]MBR7781579.1 efflux RND transporter periplasmic adaptor subunit [Undibacterium luofuense]
MRRRLLCMAVTSVLLAACSQDQPVSQVSPKPVKIEVAGSTGTGHADSFVGTLRARQRTDLSFEAAGRVQKVLVDIGDKVRAGQVLAQLDEAPARWRAMRAQADRDSAAATLAERQNWLQQQQALARENIISATALQAAQASHQQAQSQLAASEAALASARRDLGLTRITAPFDGEIVARLVQAHHDITPGQAILQLESGKALELVAQLPEQLASQLRTGSSATAQSGDLQFPARLERVSRRSENGSLVQAVFAVSEVPATIRSGSVVTLALPQEKQTALTVPASALLPSAEAQKAEVMILQGDRVQKRTVKTEGALSAGGRIAVTGIQAGEKVVVAGAATLHDGQAAIAYTNRSVLQGASK